MYRFVGSSPEFDMLVTVTLTHSMAIVCVALSTTLSTYQVMLFAANTSIVVFFSLVVTRTSFVSIRPILGIMHHHRVRLPHV